MRQPTDEEIRKHYIIDDSPLPKGDGEMLINVNLEVEASLKIDKDSEDMVNKPLAMAMALYQVCFEYTMWSIGRVRAGTINQKYLPPDVHLTWRGGIEMPVVYLPAPMFAIIHNHPRFQVDDSTGIGGRIFSLHFKPHFLVDSTATDSVTRIDDTTYISWRGDSDLEHSSAVRVKPFRY